MAGGAPKPVIVLEATRAKIRYGRATLTLNAAPAVVWKPVHEELTRFDAGEGSEDEVAWSFIRGQVVEVSPSFEWADAKLERLLPRVTSAMSEPPMRAATPAELIGELRGIEKLDFEALKSTRESLRTTARQWSTLVSPQFDLASHVGDQVTFYQPKMSAFNNLKIDWQGVSSIPLKRSNSKIVWEGFGDLLATMPIVNSFVGDLDFTQIYAPAGGHDWSAIADNFVSVARRAEQPDVAEIVETTTATVGEVDELDLGAVIDRLRPLFADLEKTIRESKEPKDSTTKLLIVGVAIVLISILIQLILAHFGIYLIPPAPPS